VLLLAVPGAALGARQDGRLSMTYASGAALARFAAANQARIVRRIPALHVAELAGDTHALALAARHARGIGSPTPLRARHSRSEPSLQPDPGAAVPGSDYEWQYAATHMDAIPAWVLHAAASVPLAVIDTGADLAAPDLAAKLPSSYSVTQTRADVTDANGHGTFVASIAAGSPDNGDGMAGFGGDAPLLVVQAGSKDGVFSEFDEAAAIVYAVDRGARVINLSIGGPRTSPVERRAVDYAVARGALLVAAVGNEQALGNPVEYPAALLQPVDSQGVGGAGLAVGGSDAVGGRAWFANSGSWLSLVAPAVQVFGAVARTSSPLAYERVPLPGARLGLYGFKSGTSFAAPQVAGAAALVWAANPTLTARQVADTLERSASGQGAWNPDTGFGVLDGAAAVAEAAAQLPAGKGVGWIAARASGQVLRARLAASLAALPLAGRELLVDRAYGAHWRTIGRRTVDSTGAATWKVKRGVRYRLRFAGAADLTAATSPTATS
jgi:subtilisin family serine protease